MSISEFLGGICSLCGAERSCGTKSGQMTKKIKKSDRKLVEQALTGGTDGNSRADISRVLNSE